MDAREVVVSKFRTEPQRRLKMPRPVGVQCRVKRLRWGLWRCLYQRLTQFPKSHVLSFEVRPLGVRIFQAKSLEFPLAAIGPNRPRFVHWANDLIVPIANIRHKF